VSDDGQQGLTIIAFIGSVFSPYYAFARRRDGADPLNHVAINVALYGGRGDRWAMTERGRAALQRSRDALMIGPSGLAWDGTGLTIRIDERAAPLPRRVKGIVRLHPTAAVDRTVTLDAAGQHVWQPLAPCARIEVAFEEPACRWTGSGYFDTNRGETPLEDAFSHWDWCRAQLADGTAILYDAVRRDGSLFTLTERIDPSGRIEPFLPPPMARLPASRWGVKRRVRANANDVLPCPFVVDRFEDGPFYARSLLALPLFGERSFAVHESLSLDRFRALWVQALLPFRMPRALGWGAARA
jgi:carotenoid 1,2-hydratase